MIVADEHEVDLRQILEPDARLGDARRPEPNGPALLLHTGSVRMLSPLVCTSTLECPTHVASIRSPSTRAGGLAGVTATRAGQAGRPSLPVA